MVTTFKVYTDASSRYKAVMVEDRGANRSRKVYPSSIGAVIKNGYEVVGANSGMFETVREFYADVDTSLKQQRSTHDASKAFKVS